MKVVLVQDVRNVGSAGEVKEVSDGYAKNYLIPAGLATLATPGAVKTAEARRKEYSARQAKADIELAQFASALDGKQVEIAVKAGVEGGRIYGSVTTEDIADALKKQHGLDVDRKRIDLEKPIHELGTFDVMVKLSPGLSARLSVVVKGE